MIPKDFVIFLNFKYLILKVVFNTPGKHQSSINLVNDNGNFILFISWLNRLDSWVWVLFVNLESYDPLVGLFECLS